jgi:hypothetical protein
MKQLIIPKINLAELLDLKFNIPNMRYLLPIANAIFILSLYSCSDDPNNDIHKDGLHGAVKMVTEIAYEGNEKLGGDSLAQEFSSIETRYDRHGYQLEKSYYDKGHLILKIVPKRNHKELIGNLKMNGDGELILKSTFKKISDNEYEEINVRPNDTLFSTERIRYENNRKVSGIITYQVLEYKSSYKFNSDGLMTYSEQKNNSGEEEFCYNFEYLEFDKHNNWIRRKDFNANGSKNLRFTTIRKYEYY